MRKCGCCGHESNEPTCPKCGEASWLDVDAVPTSEQPPAKSASKRKKADDQ